MRSVLAEPMIVMNGLLGIVCLDCFVWIWIEIMKREGRVWDAFFLLTRVAGGESKASFKTVPDACQTSMATPDPEMNLNATTESLLHFPNTS